MINEETWSKKSFDTVSLTITLLKDYLNLKDESKILEESS